MAVTSLRAETLWVRDDSLAKSEAARLASSNPVASKMHAELAKIPTAVWLSGSSPSTSTVDSYLDRAAGKVVVLVAYNVPVRDLNGYSGGGAASESEYRAWVDRLAAGIQGRLCLVVVEPDALAMLPSLDSAKEQERYRCLNHAVDAFTAAGALAYLECGGNAWTPLSSGIAERLEQAGIHRARGFASNVARFQFASAEHEYATSLVDRLGGTPRYLVDVGRSGRGEYVPMPGESSKIRWCNPPGVGFGKRPTLKPSTRWPACDAECWVKGISSDGEREGQPEAGKAYPENVVRMYHRAVPKLPVVW